MFASQDTDYSFRGYLPLVVVIDVYIDRENGGTSSNKVAEKWDIGSSLPRHHTCLDFVQT